jgi:hypothetical protein
MKTTPEPLAIVAATRMIRAWAAQTVDSSRGMGSGDGGFGAEAPTPQDDHLTVALWLQARRLEHRALVLARLVLRPSTVLYSPLASLRTPSPLGRLLAELEEWAYCQALEMQKENLRTA